MTRFFGCLAVVLLVFVLVIPASATLINGTVNFGSPVANVMVPTMNTATFIGAPSFTVVTPGTGDFVASLGKPGTAVNIPGNGPVAGFLTFNGFTIDVTNFLGPNVWTKVSLGGVDFVGLGFQGVVKHAGYQDTAVTGSITTQYAGGYDPTKPVAWSGNINAAVPEPATFALMGLGLLALGLVTRRRRA